jgi:molecular chaperone HscC
LEQAELTQPVQIARLRQNCELAKRKLFAEPTVLVDMPDATGALGEGSTRIAVSREKFAELCKGLLDRLKQPIAKVMRDADRSSNEIDDVILVGGATRMAPVQKFIEEFLSCRPRCEYNPDEVVALGAAIQAALIVDDAAVDDIVMTDVCPHSLGVEVVKDLGERRRTGFFVPIVHRNTTIPVSREEVFYTAEDNQTNVIIRVFQGESRYVSENIELGELTISGVPRAPAGIPITVRFTYDLNGILEVEAFVQDAPAHFRQVMTTSALDLSEAELREAVARMQQLKFYPRDDRENLRLLYHAVNALSEVGALQRAHLERAVDEYESAMNLGDRSLFNRARDELLIMLSAIEFPFSNDSL